MVSYPTYVFFIPRIHLFPTISLPASSSPFRFRSCSGWASIALMVRLYSLFELLFFEAHFNNWSLSTPGFETSWSRTFFHYFRILRSTDPKIPYVRGARILRSTDPKIPYVRGEFVRCTFLPFRPVHCKSDLTISISLWRHAARRASFEWTVASTRSSIKSICTISRWPFCAQKALGNGHTRISEFQRMLSRGVLIKQRSAELTEETVDLIKYAAEMEQHM